MRAVAVPLAVGLLLLAGCTSAPPSPPGAQDTGQQGFRDPTAPLARLPPGCDAAQRDAPTSASSKPTPPLRSRLEVCDPRGFFGSGSEVVFALHASSSRGDEVVEAGIVLPPGVVLVRGDVEFRGALPPGGLRLVATLRAPPGEHVLRSWAEVPSWNRNGTRIGTGELVGLRGTSADAEAFEPSCVTPVHPACVLPSVTVVLQATSSNPSLLTAGITAPVAMPVRAMFWSGAEVVEGWREWEFHLQPGQPVSLNATVRLPEEWIRGDHGGTSQAVLFVYPHASVAGHVAEDYVHYVVEDGRVVARDGPGPV